MLRRGVSIGAVLAVLSGALLTPGAAPAGAAPAAAPAVTAGVGGTYVPLAPTRVLDTRRGLGAPRATTTRLSLELAGHGGLPAEGVSAVVLNVTVTGATGAGWLAVSPSGTTASSNVNFVARRDVAQLVTSRLGASGTVVVTASARVHVVADLVGWFTDPAHAATGATYQPATPRRLFDSRRSTNGRLVGGVSRRIPLTGVPAGASAVAVDLTTVRPDGNVYVTAWGSGPRPPTSSMNAARGDVRSNRAIVPVAADTSITLFVDAGRADVVVDLSGWFTAGAGAAGGSRFVALEPHRVFDSRNGTGELAPSGWAEPLSGTSLPVAGHDDLPPADALIHLTAAWLNVTVVSSRWTGWTALAPTRGHAEDAQPVPGTSDLNWGRGTTPDAVLATLGDGGSTSITSRYGSVDVAGHPELVVDLAGVFVRTPATPATGLWAQGRYVFLGGSRSDSWNRAVPGAAGDIVEVTGTGPSRGETATLRSDGTVSVWHRDDAGPSTLTTGGVHLAATRTGVYVVERDGTVWTDDDYPGAHGVTGSVREFGPVTGVTQVRSVAALDTGSPTVGVRTDGSVVAWGGRAPAAHTVTWLTDPVVGVALDPAGVACVANADGSVDVVDGSASRGRSSVIGARSVTTSPTSDCYALDSSGRIHELTLAGHTVTDLLLTGPAVTAIVGSQTDVTTFDGSYTPQVRVLRADHTVWDRVGTGADGRWLPVAELDGAAAIGGGWSLDTWVPPAG